MILVGASQCDAPTAGHPWVESFRIIPCCATPNTLSVLASNPSCQTCRQNRSLQACIATAVNLAYCCYGRE